MLANPRQKRRRGRMPPALAAYWAARRGTGGHRRRRRTTHALNPRRRSYARKSRRRTYRRNPSLTAGLSRTFSTAGLTQAAYVAAGMVTPSLVTDRLLPMVGIVLTGWLRRGAQLAVPLALQAFAPRILGAGTTPFLLGAMGVTALGAVNDLTGGMPGMVGRVRGYERIPPGMGTSLRGFEARPGLTRAGALMI